MAAIVAGKKINNRHASAIRRAAHSPKKTRHTISALRPITKRLRVSAWPMLQTPGTYSELVVSWFKVTINPFGLAPRKSFLFLRRTCCGKKYQSKKSWHRGNFADPPTVPSTALILIVVGPSYSVDNRALALGVFASQ
jgi:hypothetical protein